MLKKLFTNNETLNFGNDLSSFFAINLNEEDLTDFKYSFILNRIKNFEDEIFFRNLSLDELSDFLSRALNNFLLFDFLDVDFICSSLNSKNKKTIYEYVLSSMIDKNSREKSLKSLNNILQNMLAKYDDMLLNDFLPKNYKRSSFLTKFNNFVLKNKEVKTSLSNEINYLPFNSFDIFIAFYDVLKSDISISSVERYHLVKTLLKHKKFDAKIFEEPLDKLIFKAHKNLKSRDIPFLLSRLYQHYNLPTRCAHMIVDSEISETTRKKHLEIDFYQNRYSSCYFNLPPLKTRIRANKINISEFPMVLCDLVLAIIKHLNYEHKSVNKIYFLVLLIYVNKILDYFEKTEISEELEINLPRPKLMTFVYYLYCDYLNSGNLLFDFIVNNHSYKCLNIKISKIKVPDALKHQIVKNKINKVLTNEIYKSLNENFRV